MMKRLLRKPAQAGQVVLVVLTLLAIALPWQSVSAETIKAPLKQENTYTLADFDYRTDINFQGVRVDQTFNITLPANWELTTDATLTIRFSHSPALHESSSMVVNWNEERLGSTLLTEEDAQRGEYTISIPSGKVNQGYNALQIEFYMGLQDDFCIDYDNPAVWAVVHNNTSISFSHEMFSGDTTLGSAPAALMDNSLLTDNAVTLIVPPNPDNEHLQALTIIASQLGRWADWRRSSMSMMTTEEALAAAPSGNLVLVATREEVSSFDTDLARGINAGISDYYNSDTNHPDILTGDGMVSWQPSPFDPKFNALLLSGETPEAVLKSAKAVTFEPFFSQAEGNWSLVRSVPEPQPITDALGVSFADLGYENLTAYGTREQTLTYNFPLSSLWNIDSEAWLDLSFLHAKLLNGNRSTLNVLVNGIPVTSFELNDRNADDGYEEIRIPLRYLIVGDNTITLQANMDFTDDVGDFQQFCTDDTYPRAWLTIQADSGLRFPDVPQHAPLSISQFPYGFANTYSYEGFAFGLPPAPSVDTLKALSQLAFSFGKALPGNPTEIQVIQTADDPATYQDFNYVVLLGETNAILSTDLNAQLPVPLDLATGLPVNNDLTLQADNTEGSLGFVEAFQFEDGPVVLLVTGNDTQALSEVTSVLSQPGIRQSLEGSVAVISSRESAAAYQPEGTGRVTLAQPRNQIMINTPLEIGGQSIWILWVTAGILGISVIILLVALLRKNTRGEES
ncbi:cellulose biosynthesis cyclic di-GMP-binding regulatory protein BcsB [bacterium]|nr:cellulose biosynthesis cyclic di-GMP-binding regulatory protein BcsB [bacterium]